MFKRMHREEGFTLIELMIVILIIGILVGIAVPVFLAATSSAEEKTCQSNQRSWLSATDIFASDTGAYPADAAAWTATADTYYDGNVPVCPSGGVITLANWGAEARPTTTCADHGSPGD